MKPKPTPRAVAGLVFGLFVVADAAGSAGPAEPPGYRMDDYRASTPATVAGGGVLDTAGARALWENHRAVWIDVLAAPHRPANLPAAAVWMPVPRRDIPGSLWLPDVGRGTLDARLEAYFRANLDRATKGRLDMPVVLYCRADCWLSWNASKRAASWGYRGIYWYRDGTDGWAAAKLPLAIAEPVPGYR